MNEIIKLVDKVLPLDASKVGIAYNESQNMLVTTGYTSYAGNTYFKGIRLSERIFIVFDIGIGYYHTFLNAVTVLTNSNGEKKTIGTKGHYNHKFNENTIKEDAKAIVKDKLLTEAKADNVTLDENWLNEFVTTLVEDAYKNQIETLKNLQVNNLLTK